jgi:hypothetical protein
MTAPGHDMQAIERALEHHRTRGAIRSWASLWPASGYRWRVELTSGTVELRSLREAHVFAAALARPRRAPARRPSASPPKWPRLTRTPPATRTRYEP